MPNITRGGNARGLLSYLFGPGRTNEHTDQHIIAGTDDIADAQFFGGRVLSNDEALRVGARLDLDRLEHGTEVLGTRTHWDYTRQTMVTDGRGPAHVWHCSLTLHPDEAPLSDDQWSRIANDFMDEMGLTDAAGKAPCRWVAVRHGTNSGGGDHIHIACVLIREDGTKANVWRDYVRAQAACNTLEHKYGLAVVESRERQRGALGETPAEQRTANEKGTGLTDRARLELAIRAAAAGAETETEFVTALREQGVLVRPRYARGTREYVDGYSVACRPSGDQRPHWIGGGYVARDLSLRRLRTGWHNTADARRQALPYWQPRPHHALQKPQYAQQDLWRDMAGAIDKLIDDIDRIAPGDAEQLSSCARHAAGIFSALALRYDTKSFELSRAARSLGMLAQFKPMPTRPGRIPPRSQRRFIRSVVSATARPSSLAVHSATRLATALTRSLELDAQLNTARRTRSHLQAALRSLEPRRSAPENYAAQLSRRVLEASFTPMSTYGSQTGGRETHLPAVHDVDRQKRTPRTRRQ